LANAYDVGTLYEILNLGRTAIHVPVTIQTTDDDMSLVSPGLVKNVGPGFTEFINKEVQTEEDALRNIRQKEIDFCKASIAGEQAAQVPY
jgi:hypothetical protein